MSLSYPKTIEYLYSLQKHGIKLGLENIQRLLTLLGNPHQQFRSIHVAGTNGKGSTAAIIAAILRTAGYRTGLYTSPHLIDFTERIRIDDVRISPKNVARLTEQCALAGVGIPLTFFEFTTAMAFQYFAQHEVEIAVVEVGLGGRFDATNVLNPDVSIITNVDYDHQKYLGNSLREIATEKAGTIKPGVPVITAADQPEALEVIRTVSRERGSPLVEVGNNLRVESPEPHYFNFNGTRWSLSGLDRPLRGSHQVLNSACALGALERLEDKGIPMDEAALRRGLKDVRWEGRLELIPATDSDAVVILDGAHNPAGARALGNFLKTSLLPKPGRTILILGILQDKDVEGMLSLLAPLMDEVVLTRPQYERAASVEELKHALEPYPIQVVIREPVSEALRYARSVTTPADRICVAGSLFTVGEARACLMGTAQPSMLRG